MESRASEQRQGGKMRIYGGRAFLSERKGHISVHFHRRSHKHPVAAEWSVRVNVQAAVGKAQHPWREAGDMAMHPANG